MMRIFHTSVLSAAVLGVTAFLVAPSTAHASFCGDTINTAWSAPDDIDTWTNETSFVGCSTGSTLAGQGVLFTIDPDPYSITVSALDGDTFGLRGTIEDIGSTGVGDSPGITLVLSDIDWTGGPGVITGVTDNSAFFDLVSFTADSITINGSFSCVSSECPFSNVDLGSFDVAARHTVIPLPAAVWMFLTALGGLGITGWRRTRAAI